jgi:hypothetical protein
VRSSSTTCRAAACLAAVGLVWLAGCGDESGGGTAPTITSPSPTSESTTSESTTSESTTTTEPGTATTEPPAPGGLVGTLLPASELPQLNPELAWREVATRRTESDPQRWVCQQFPLVSNGAVTAVERTYGARGGLTAAEVVGRFADRRSAARGFAVLLANAEDCAEQLRRLDREPAGSVDALTSVPVDGGQGAWGVLFSGPVPGSDFDAYIDAVAVVQVGELVAVTSMSSIGQDYNYEPGQAPPELAIPVVATALGGG